MQLVEQYEKTQVTSHFDKQDQILELQNTIDKMMTESARQDQKWKEQIQKKDKELLLLAGGYASLVGG